MKGNYVCLTGIIVSGLDKVKDYYRHNGVEITLQLDNDAKVICRATGYAADAMSRMHDRDSVMVAGSVGLSIAGNPMMESRTVVMVDTVCRITDF